MDGQDMSKWISQAKEALKDPDFTALLKRALDQCFTPQNESLSDIVVFNRYFQEHPGDMFELGARAIIGLVKDFLPSHLATSASVMVQANLSKLNQTEA